jgi:hypothetical protein
MSTTAGNYFKKDYMWDFFSLADQYPQLFNFTIFPCPFPIYKLELNMNRMPLFSEAHICIVCKKFGFAQEGNAK